MKNLFLIPFILLFYCCGDIPVDQNAEAEKLMQLSKDWAQAAMERDVEKVAAFWADDAVIMSPDEPAMKGITAIRQMVAESMQIPGFEVQWEPQEAFVSKGGDLGYVLIKNYFKIPTDTLGNTTVIYNKGVEIWKKQSDGQWKNVVDIYNGDPTINSIK
jgi:ketosteroid isomerase-like protein